MIIENQQHYLKYMNYLINGIYSFMELNWDKYLFYNKL